MNEVRVLLIALQGGLAGIQKPLSHGRRIGLHVATDWSTD